MAERQTRTQLVQVGVEGTAGSKSTVTNQAYKQLVSLMIEPSVQAEIDVFKPAGYKYSTVAALGREWTEASVTGQPTYTEIVYPFSSLVKTAVTASGTGSANAYRWSFTSSTSAADTPTTYTVQHGDTSVRADEFTYGVVTGLTQTFNRSETSLDGSMLGQLFTDNITLSGTTSSPLLKPVLPKQVCVYLNNTLATLQGGSPTKLTRVMNVEVALTDKFGPVWAVDCGEDSWVALVEPEPTGQVTLTLEANAQGMGLLTPLRNGDTRYMRIEATGDAIDTTFNFLLREDFALKVTDIGDFSDEDGVYAIQYTFDMVHDTSWDKAFHWQVWNSQSAL